MAEAVETHPGEPPLWRQFASFLWPLLMTNGLQAISGTLNNIYLGRLLGPEAIAVASGGFALHGVLLAFDGALAAGAGILIAQAWGGKDVDKVRRIAGAVLCGSLLLAVVLAVAASMHMPTLLRALNQPEEIVVMSSAYARIVMAGLPVNFAILHAIGMIRATGNTTIAMRSLVVYTVVLVVLTPLLVTGFGVLGAAVSTIVSLTASLAWVMRDASRQSHPLAWKALRPHLRFDGGVMWTVLKLGIPGAVYFMTAEAADLAVLTLVNAHGADAMAAWGAVSQLTRWVLFPAMGISIAASVFAAHAIGAGDSARIAPVLRCALLLNLGACGALALIFTLAAPQLLHLVVGGSPVHETGAALLRISVWGAMIYGLANVFAAIMRAAGTVVQPTLIYIACVSVLLYPVASALEAPMGLPGVWLTYPVTYAVALALQAGYFYAVWRRRPIVKLV